MVEQKPYVITASILYLFQVAGVFFCSGGGVILDVYVDKLTS